jgi:IclR family pca regulon transcriptional regulator
LFVSTLEKSFRVLKAFRRAQREWGVRDLNLNEIAMLAELDKSAAQRFTSTLTSLGYLEKDAYSRRYRPGIRLIDFYYTYMVSDWLAEIAMPRLIEAAKFYDTTVNLAELDGPEIVYTVRIPHERASYRSALAGRRMPAFCTAAGIVMLAHKDPTGAADILDCTDFTPVTEHTVVDRAAVEARIDRARHRGFEVGESQVTVNELSTAAPVLDVKGRAVAAVQIPVYQPAWTLQHVHQYIVPLVTETARAISGTLFSQG